MNEMEEDLGLEQLKLLKAAFDGADDDGSGELDLDEFCEQLGPYLGANLSKIEVSQLFMKIDADAGGTVDWDEFTNYMFLQRSENDEDNVENWRFFPMIDKYITCGRDSTFRVWNGHDLKHMRTVNNGSQWINDVTFLPKQHKIVVVSMDRTISYYDVHRGAYDLTGRVYTSGGMGVPMCASTIDINEQEHVIYGDTKGAVILVLCDSNQLPARDLLYTAHHQDYMNIHTEHTDWVTKVESIHDVGLVSSSMDSRILITDISREKVLHCATHHKKGVADFVWCKTYSLFASCAERCIVLWQGNTTRRIGELPGHTALISKLAMDEDTQHLISMSTDKVIKVWDLRTNKCLQTIGEEDWLKPEESKPSTMLYDSVHKRLVTACSKPYIWDHKLIMQDKTGHREGVVKAIFNTSFEIVCSVDQGGCVIVWNIETGQRQGRFQNAHGDSKVTACCFDSNERRLVTAGNDGQVKIWNFNNGSLLREYKHDDEPLEICKVIFLTDEKRKSDCVYAGGWNQKVYIWEDEDEDVVEEYKTLENHKDDILAMDAYLDRAILATGDYEGRINVWNINSGERRTSMYHRADRYDNSVDALQWLPLTHPDSLVNPMLLLSAGADGIIRVWLVSAVGELLCTLQGATGYLETVKDICCDMDYKHVVMSDSSGHIKVWSVAGLDVSTPEKTYESFKLRSYFRVSESPANGIQTVLDRELLLVASADTNVYCFNLDGGLIGIFGVHSWDIHDITTYQDIRGLQTMPPLDDTINLYEAAKLTKEPVELKREPEREPLPWDGTNPATHALQERRQRIQANLVQKSCSIHCNLTVHPLQDIPSGVDDLMSRGTRAKKGANKRNKKANR